MNTDFEKLKITDDEFAAVKIANSADRPNAMSTYGGAKKSAQDVKAMFDKAPELLMSKHNALVEAVVGKANALDAAEKERDDAEKERDDAEKERDAAEKERDAAELSREAAERIREERISGRLGDSGSVTLLASNWSSANAQTVTIEGLREDDMVIFYPSTADEREYCGLYGVFISPVSNGNSFIATARAIPAGDISLRYYVIRGSLPEIEEAE